MDEYNFERPHEALNLQTPGSIYEPSNREWKGVLCSPEYDTAKMKVRKVCPNGCVHWKQMPCYIGQVLAGEYLGLQEVGEGCFHTYYGPIFLGSILEGKGLSTAIEN